MGKLFEEYKPQFSSHQWEYECLKLHDEIKTYTDMVSFLNSDNVNYITYILDRLAPIAIENDMLSGSEKINLLRQISKFENDPRVVELDKSYAHDDEELELKPLKHYTKKLTDVLISKI